MPGGGLHEMKNFAKKRAGKTCNDIPAEAGASAEPLLLLFMQPKPKE